MKAAVFQGIGLGHKIETCPEPAPSARQVLVRVEGCGICGSDIQLTEARGKPTAMDPIYDRWFRPGKILGHEVTGEVVAVGKEVERLKVGDRISAMAAAGCGGCLSCLSGRADWCPEIDPTFGGYAEFALAHESFCVKVAPGVSAVDSVLIEPMATSLHAVSMASLTPASRVLVIGAGPIGLGIAHFARRAGVRKVIVVARSNRNRKLALAMGADEFWTQSDEIVPRILEEYSGGADVVFEAAGARGVIGQAMMCARPQGTVIVAGIFNAYDEVDHQPALYKELRLQYSVSYSRTDFEILAELFERKELPFTDLVTGRVSFDEFPLAFEDLRNPNSHCKVILDPSLEVRR